MPVEPLSLERSARLTRRPACPTQGHAPTPHLAATTGQPDSNTTTKETLPATTQADKVPGREGEGILKDLSRSKEEYTSVEREPAPFSSDALGRPLPVFRKE